MTENATATWAATETSPGTFQYTITLTDTGTTPIGNFWFAWDDVPDQDFMSQSPTNIGGPDGWGHVVTTHLYGDATGYGIRWNAGNSLNPGDTTSAFTFTSTETPDQMAAVSPFDPTFQTTWSFVYVGFAGNTPGASFVVEKATTGSGVIGSLNINQQLELIYIAYFNRAADGSGFSFWKGQNANAQAAGQTAATALTNIANSFAPQLETEALYPSLDPYVGTSNPPPLNTSAGQTALSTFITGVYGNLFNHVPDPAGATYWVGQLTSGAVGLGAAALAIANGASGADATALMNKINTAITVTPGATSAALAGLSSSPPGSLVGTTGPVLNDAGAISDSLAATGSVDTNVIIVIRSDRLIDPGAGSHTIQFLAGASADTLVLHEGGVDQVSGFDLSGDVLDLRSLLAAANIDLGGDTAVLGNFVTVADQGTDAVVGFDPTGHAGGGTVAVLHGLGGKGGLGALIAHGAVRIT